MNYPPIIEAGELVLRPFSLEDASQVMEFAGSTEIYENTLNMPHPYTELDAVKWISSHASRFFNGEGIESAVTLDDRLIGVVGISVNTTHKRGELGYWFGKPFWNKGYATKAVKAVMKFAFTEMDLHKLTARHFPHNPASGRVLEKAGFTKEGYLREEYLKDGKFLDAVLFSCLKEEFEAF